MAFTRESKTQWTEKFRSVVAIRGDSGLFRCHKFDDGGEFGNVDTTILPSPEVKFGFWTVWAKTEIYADGGFSFHSNDGRGATQNIEPVSAGNPTPNTPTARIPGLIQTKGGEIGVRTLAVPHLQSTLSLWYLYSDSELEQDGDTGGTVASKEPSNRYGVEWANFYKPIEHLTLDLDMADSMARFTSADAVDASPISPGSTIVGAGGTLVPEAVGAVISGGVTLADERGFSASLRARYFGPRDLTSDGIYRSQATLLMNAEAGYQINKHWRVFAEFLNLFDSRDHDIDYAYTSRITPMQKGARVHGCFPS